MAIERNDSHSRLLRKGRFSELGAAYALRASTLERKPLLWLGLAGQAPWADAYCEDSAAAAVIKPLLWLQEQGTIMLGGFAVMPDHTHVLIGLTGGMSLQRVVQSWKRASARDINMMRGRTGSIWQEGYYDHMLRSPKDTAAMLDYIHGNVERKFPEAVRASFPYCSAHPRWQTVIGWSWFT